MALRTAFKATVALTLTAAGGVAGYIGGSALHHRAAETPMPAANDKMRATAKAYESRFAKLADEQKRIEQTTDEEAAAQALLNDKTGFVSDAILDKNLSERDLRVLAYNFNKLSGEDGIRFRSHNFDARVMARRNECLRTTPAVHETFGRDRYAYAQRVETCMIERTQAVVDHDMLAAHMGAAMGGFAVGGFFLGYGAARRRAKPAA